jgi:dihydropyrimidinase
VLLFAEQAKDQSLKQQGSYTDYGFHAIITDPTEGSIRE